MTVDIAKNGGGLRLLLKGEDSIDQIILDAFVARAEKGEHVKLERVDGRVVIRMASEAV